nr:MAG TPA: hypothetical protein [Caudoviricetes sp.]
MSVAITKKYYSKSDTKKQLENDRKGRENTGFSEVWASS